MYHKAISAHKKCFLLEFLIGFINVKQWIKYTLLAPRMNFSNKDFVQIWLNYEMKTVNMDPCHMWYYLYQYVSVVTAVTLEV